VGGEEEGSADGVLLLLLLPLLLLLLLLPTLLVPSPPCVTIFFILSVNLKLGLTGCTWAIQAAMVASLGTPSMVGRREEGVGSVLLELTNPSRYSSSIVFSPIPNSRTVESGVDLARVERLRVELKLLGVGEAYLFVCFCGRERGRRRNQILTTAVFKAPKGWKGGEEKCIIKTYTHPPLPLAPSLPTSTRTMGIKAFTPMRVGIPRRPKKEAAARVRASFLHRGGVAVDKRGEATE